MDLVEAESVFSETTAKEWFKGAAVEEIKIMDAAPVVLQEILQQPVRGREDDWLVLLDGVSRQASFVPPGIALLHLFL